MGQTGSCREGLSALFSLGSVSRPSRVPKWTRRTTGSEVSIAHLQGQWPLAQAEAALWPSGLVTMTSSPLVGNI